MPQLFSAARLRRSASFRRLTGVSVATFDRMLKQLRDPWEAAQRRKSKCGRPWEIGGLEDHLLIMLMYYPSSLLSGQYPNKFNWLSSMTYAELLVV